MAKALESAVPQVSTTVFTEGRLDPDALNDAAALVVYADGGGGNPIIRYSKEIEEFVRRGGGLACLHYAVEVPKGEHGDKLRAWIGGYFEQWWSVNPTWTAEFTEYPEHPITRGLRPFSLQDEWYYHMRFDADATHLLTAVPPEETRNRPDGPHSGNEHVRARKGMPETLAWCIERPDGGRGFGFTGGHWHKNWEHDDFRKIVLNGIRWIAGREIPSEGIETGPIDQ